MPDPKLLFQALPDFRSPSPLDLLLTAYLLCLSSFLLANKFCPIDGNLVDYCAFFFPLSPITFARELNLLLGSSRSVCIYFCHLSLFITGKMTNKVFCVILSIILSVVSSAVVSKDRGTSKYPPLLVDPPRSLYIPTTARQLHESTLLDINMHVASESLTDSQCGGSTVLHEAVAFCNTSRVGLQGVSILPHASIVHDGNRCGTGDPLDYTHVVPAALLIDGRTASLSGVGPLYNRLSANARAFNAFGVLNDLAPVYVGFEFSNSRVCGGNVVYPQGTIYIFIRTRPDASDLNFGFAYLGAAELGMVTVKDDEQLCLYKETRKLAPGQSPLSTPTPSPTGVPRMPQDTFILENAPELARNCFPLRGFNTTRTGPQPTDLPGPTASPSASPTISVTPSVTPSNVPTPSPSPSMQVSPSPSPSPSNTIEGGGEATPEADEDDSVCFPESAHVELECGEVKAIGDISIGDRVLVSGRAYSEVYLFTHRDSNVLYNFYRIKVSSGAVISLTSTHYIPVDGRLKTAESVHVGDVLTLGNGTFDVVTGIDRQHMRGLFNPHTLEGTIVVDGIVASTFTKTVMPSVGEALLAPIRMMFKWRMFDGLLGAMFKEGNSMLVRYVPRGGALW
ncbi:Protein hedgehog [Gracilariopsis chorda]|uniref:Protein hedgehog n=1 Tax=Gracilariopsis chorda TaxID=448386 RepID=A0A2V3IR48_9FLOR|nr:Protein hedgehog [Gracilariopsis chorda]|eukprot:PXF44601.1 Protein hedgehog [Gracilariopsis chorda]